MLNLALHYCGTQVGPRVSPGMGNYCESRKLYNQVSRLLTLNLTIISTKKCPINRTASIVEAVNFYNCLTIDISAIFCQCLVLDLNVDHHVFDYF